MAKQTVEYWRNPTPSEIAFGEGAIHWLTVDADVVRKPAVIAYLSVNVNVLQI